MLMRVLARCALVGNRVRRDIDGIHSTIAGRVHQTVRLAVEVIAREIQESNQMPATHRRGNVSDQVVVVERHRPDVRHVAHGLGNVASKSIVLEAEDLKKAQGVDGIRNRADNTSPVRMSINIRLGEGHGVHDIQLHQVRQKTDLGRDGSSQRRVSDTQMVQQSQLADQRGDGTGESRNVGQLDGDRIVTAVL
jgi:hypothetical protein